MFCEKCGNQIASGTKFCQSCGAKVEGQPGAVTGPQSLSPPPPPPAGPPLQAAPPPPVYGRPVQTPPPPGPAVQANSYSPPQPYMAAPAYGAQPQSINAPLSVGQYIGTFFLLAIPLVNLILLLLWSFGSSVNLNRKNFARATLIMSLISIVLWFIVGGVITKILGDIMSEFY